MKAAWAALAIVSGSSIVAGCSTAPTCSDILDASGRPVVLCGPREIAVCDEPGQEAMFVDDEVTGIVLMGGQPASCTTAFEVVCPTGTEGEAYCLVDPEL